MFRYLPPLARLGSNLHFLCRLEPGGGAIGARIAAVARLGPGFWYVKYSSQAEPWIRDGMPVVYKGHRVGTVFEHWSEGGCLHIGYYADPHRHVPARVAEPALTPGGPKGPFVNLLPPT